MTHYATLGVPENASQEEIKRAFRKLAGQHHPDKGGNTAEFQRIQEAYSIIGDEQKRAQYDTERRGGGGFRFTVNGQDFGSGMPPEMEDMLRNFGFAFGNGFANHADPFGAFRQPRRNKDINVNLVISLASTLESQTKTISVQTSNGERHTVQVEIPRGVQPNSSIKYPGLGDNFFGSLPRGDLYVRISVESNPNFGVDNLDLHQNLEIDCIRAMVGGVVTVQGLDSRRFDLTIPPGTQPNTKFRIPGQGLFALNQNARGSLIVNVKINVPINLSDEQIQTLKHIFFIQ